MARRTTVESGLTAKEVKVASSIVTSRMGRLSGMENRRLVRWSRHIAQQSTKITSGSRELDDIPPYERVPYTGRRKCYNKKASRVNSRRPTVIKRRRKSFREKAAQGARDGEKLNDKCKRREKKMCAGERGG